MAKTAGPVRAYCDMMQKLHDDGDAWLVFQIPDGSSAFRLGYRFGSCRLSERRDYEDGGAVFL
jgi:hypothetical protein